MILPVRMAVLLVRRQHFSSPQWGAVEGHTEALGANQAAAVWFRAWMTSRARNAKVSTPQTIDPDCSVIQYSTSAMTIRTPLTFQLVQQLIGKPPSDVFRETAGQCGHRILRRQNS